MPYYNIVAKELLSSYIFMKVIQVESSCSNNGMNRGSIIAVVICVDSTCIFLWNAFTFALLNCAGPLVVVYMAEEHQIHLLTPKPTIVTLV
jgi:hypothetical protein